jgi:hypothetical protein
MRRPSRIGSSVVKYVGFVGHGCPGGAGAGHGEGRVEGKAGLDGGMRLAKTAEMSEGPQLKMRVRDIPVGVDRAPVPRGRLLIAPKLEHCRAGDRHPHVSARPVPAPFGSSSDKGLSKLSP